VPMRGVPRAAARSGGPTSRPSGSTPSHHSGSSVFSTATYGGDARRWGRARMLRLALSPSLSVRSDSPVAL
jgi:hypothetical protein